MMPLTVQQKAERVKCLILFLFAARLRVPGEKRDYIEVLLVLLPRIRSFEGFHNINIKCMPSTFAMNFCVNQILHQV